MIHFLKLTTRAIDQFTEATGRLAAWLSLVMMIVTCAVVFFRYVLESGSIGAQESVTYFHATLFLLGAAYTLKHDGHVRVDILYRRFSPKGQAIVNILGGLLLLMPVAVLILLFCWDYVSASWAIQETSSDPNGLPWVYLLKTLMVIMPIALILQGISEILRNSLFLLGHGEPRRPQGEESMI